ncbi:MAG: hypothetical protein V4472_26560 [Pseudomonadota bacterium]
MAVSDPTIAAKLILQKTITIAVPGVAFYLVLRAPAWVAADARLKHVMHEGRSIVTRGGLDDDATRHPFGGDETAERHHLYRNLYRFEKCQRPS